MLPRIERYEISDELGHGGMATVYRARDRRLDRWVAIKVMHAHLRGTEQARARFSREARAVAKLKHRSILEIYDYSDNESENAYIATELLTGPTLRTFVESVPELPAEIAACIGVELALALSEAHEHGIVHRDVKPENVLLHEQRLVKLTDFGIADMLDPTVSTMTATGQILGSPLHMAPEQVERGDADARSDVFSLGTILYWMATGNLPFPGKNPHQVLKRVVDCNPVDPLVARPSIGRPMRDAIMRCLAKDPGQRFARAADLAAHLLGLLNDLGIDDPQAELARYLADPPAETTRLRTQILARLLADARGFVQRRDRLPAIERLDRVLAMDDGNAQALALVRALDRASRRTVVTRVMIAACALTTLAALWTTFVPRSVAISARPREAIVRIEDGAMATPEATGELPSFASAAAANVHSGRPATPAGSAISATSPVLAENSRDKARLPRPRAKPMGPRTVIFDPEPANVTISVDGAAPRPFGPSFRLIELQPGPHTFRFVGAHGCCNDQELKLEIPPGPGQSVVPVKLSFRAARLYITTDVPADVSVGDIASGRTRSLITVPISRSLLEAQQISVTAPGREPYTGSVQLRAGQVTQLHVDLVPSAPH